ncbi:MAG: hypothetical protein AMXMBFR58_20190 [Phycisphaerae bacterium]
MPGPAIRTDVVDVYIFRRDEHRVEFLQLRRVGDPLGGTWQPIMGHIHDGETAVQTALRELGEEVGLDAGQSAAWVVGVWALDQVHPYFIARSNQIMLSPRFACEVRPGWEPVLNDEHDAARWIDTADVPWAFMWPGQMGAIDEILRCIVPAESLSREHLKVL